MKNLYEVRRRRGEGLRKFARHIGCSHISIRAWERGVSLPRPHFRDRLEAVTGLSADVLLSDDPSLLPNTTTAAAR